MTAFPTREAADAALRADWREARAVAYAESLELRAELRRHLDRDVFGRRFYRSDHLPSPATATLTAARLRYPHLDVVRGRRGWIARHRGRPITGHPYASRFDAQVDWRRIVGQAPTPWEVDGNPIGPPPWDPLQAAIDELLDRDLEVGA